MSALGFRSDMSARQSSVQRNHASGFETLVTRHTPGLIGRTSLLLPPDRVFFAATVHQIAAVGTVASARTSAKYPLRIILGRQSTSSTSTSSLFLAPRYTTAIFHLRNPTTN
jgi:hypothetical protein